MGTSALTVALATVVGLAIGFVMPALCPYTYRIQNGMNLYNVGFASGLMAMMIVPLLYAAGDDPDCPALGRGLECVPSGYAAGLLRAVSCQRNVLLP